MRVRSVVRLRHTNAEDRTPDRNTGNPPPNWERGGAPKVAPNFAPLRHKLSVDSVHG